MSRAGRLGVVVSCEHGGRELPPEWVHLGAGHEALLASHRGFDPGALELAREVAEALGVAVIATTWSRLLVEPNRSLHHPRLFSELTRDLPRDAKAEILERYYHPHRQRVEAAARAALAEHGRVLHLGIHTFTPVMGGVARKTDVGLLYDPRRPQERTFCSALKAELRRRSPDLVVHRNQPYRGASDGLTTALRRVLPAAYLGIEVEVSQRFPTADRAGWEEVLTQLAASVRRLGSPPWCP